MADLSKSYANGNGLHMPPPLSRRAFARGLPARIGVLEGQVDDQDRVLDAVRARLTAIETRADGASDAARVELVRGVVDILRLALSKRRSRRRAQGGQFKLPL